MNTNFRSLSATNTKVISNVHSEQHACSQRSPSSKHRRIIDRKYCVRCTIIFSTCIFCISLTKQTNKNSVLTFLRHVWHLSTINYAYDIKANLVLPKPILSNTFPHPQLDNFVQKALFSCLTLVPQRGTNEEWGIGIKLVVGR